MANEFGNVAGTDAYTGQSTLDFSKAAYDRLAYFALRPELYFDAAADVQPTAQSMPGSSVTFTIVNDLAISASALSENSDVATVALSDSQVTLTLAEYGNAVLTTAKLRGTAFVDIDPVVANVVGYNAGVSLDTIARSALDQGTNVQYASGLGATSLQTAVTTRAGITKANNTISALDIRVARARLRSQNVPTFGGMYVGYVHPDIVADLQGESISGSNIQGWRAPHVYAQPGEIWTGELGAFEGVRWIETPRAPIFQGSGGTTSAGAYTITTAQTSSVTGIGSYTGAAPQVGAVLSSSGATVTGAVTVASVNTGASTFTTTGTGTVTTGTVLMSNIVGSPNVYGTMILGRQALAKAYSMVDGNGAFPHVVPGPITDRLRRYVPLGWYWLGAYSIFRQASIIRIESASLLDTDVSYTLNAASTFTPAVDLGENINSSGVIN
jgi:N4-gp56 family major capsid protein